MTFLQEDFPLLPETLWEVYTAHVKEVVECVFVADRVNANEFTLWQQIDKDRMDVLHSRMEQRFEWLHEYHPDFVRYFIYTRDYWSERARILGDKIWFYVNVEVTEDG